MTPERDQWLRAVGSSLRGPRRGRRRLLAELEGHLEDAAAEEQAAGRDPEDAHAVALQRLGAPMVVAADWNADVDARRSAARLRIVVLAVVRRRPARAGRAGAALRDVPPPAAGEAAGVEDQAGTRKRDSPSELSRAFAREATSLRRSSGSTTTASPRKRRISLTSHSGLPTFCSIRAVPSTSS
jgi:HAAS domain-containing protein